MEDIGLWSLCATGLLTTILRAAQGLRVTRLDIPFLLGAMLTPDRDRAKLAGFALHFLNGLLFAHLYDAYFRALGQRSWALGAGMGLAHAAFVLVVVVPLMPTFHPRMASESRGPAATVLLEPPGFLALNYGRHTAAVTFLAHALFGAVLGGLSG